MLTAEVPVILKEVNVLRSLKSENDEAEMYAA
jgi:hypothetical protein